MRGVLAKPTGMHAYDVLRNNPVLVTENGTKQTSMFSKTILNHVKQLLLLFLASVFSDCVVKRS